MLGTTSVGALYAARFILGTDASSFPLFVLDTDDL